MFGVDWFECGECLREAAYNQAHSAQTSTRTHLELEAGLPQNGEPEELRVIQIDVEHGAVDFDIEVCEEEGAEEEGEGRGRDNAEGGEAPEDGEEPHGAVLEDCGKDGRDCGG